jgi:hypothetical protein
MRREIGVSSGSAGVDELQLIELIDEGTYGKVFRGGSFALLHRLSLGSMRSSW